MSNSECLNGELEQHENTVAKAKVIKVGDGGCYLQAGNLEFFLGGVSDVRPKDEMYVVATGVMGSTLTAITVEQDLDGMCAQLDKIEIEYNKALSDLKDNDAPYTTIYGIEEKILGIGEQIEKYKGGKLSKDLNERSVTLVKKYSSLLTTVDDFREIIDVILQGINPDVSPEDVEDENIFEKPLEVEVVEDSQYDEGGKATSELWELRARMGNFDFIVNPSGHDEDVPLYDFPNFLDGKRRVQITEVDELGIFYCDVCKPTEKEVNEHLDELDSRVKNCWNPEELPKYVYAAFSTVTYLEREGGYSEKVLNRAKSINSVVDDKACVTTAEKNGCIVHLMDEDLSQYSEVHRALLEEYSQDPNAYVVAYDVPPGQKLSVAIFSVKENEDYTIVEVNGCPPNFKTRTMKLLSMLLGQSKWADTCTIYLGSEVRFDPQGGFVYKGKYEPNPGHRSNFVYKRIASR